MRQTFTAGRDDLYKMMMTSSQAHYASLQWDLLTEFAKSQNATELLLDCAWKIGDWNAMRDALTRYSYAGAASDTPQLKCAPSKCPAFSDLKQHIEKFH